MTVSTIASIAAGITRTTGSQTTRSADALRAIVSASEAARNAQAVDVATFPTAVTLQNQVASLRLATQNIAAAGTVLEVAQSGINKIAKVLGQLQDLAVRASNPNLSASERALISSQFASIRQQINQINATTTFGGESLLDGASSQLRISGEGSSQQIGGLTEADLFGANVLDVSTADGAAQAAKQISSAQSYVVAQNEKTTLLRVATEQLAFTAESALQNNAAANSTLNDLDLQNLVGSAVAEPQVLTQTAAAQSAQISRLPSSILQLLAE
jgi:flagellin